MTEPQDATVLFFEPGARWRSVAYGPVLCAIVLIVEIVSSSPVHWFALIFCGALVAGFVALQVVAGQRHVSVELTDTALRDGAETLPLSSIAEVLPERDPNSWDDEEWESARVIGELTGVPRRRTGIGLKLADGGLVQAWARDHRGLRAALESAVSSRSSGDGESVETVGTSEMTGKSETVAKSEPAVKSEAVGKSEVPGRP
ncbi:MULTISPECIES: hypothetical protein [Nocardia]|uniref:hypothetical protein n=1 Tax=Nocardia TaxID=1817 RepID=UPI001E5AE910|nr:MULTISPECIES: hypothetical protein [Nocardia]